MSDEYQPRTQKRLLEVLRGANPNPRSYQHEAAREIERLSALVERQRKVLDQAELVLDQAKDCINAETPEDITFGEAEDDTISKIRDAMRDIAAVTSEQST